MKKKLFLIPIFVAGMTLIACGGSKPEPGPDPTGTFTVTWDLDNGTSPIVEQYQEGEMPICQNTPAYKWGSDDYHVRYFTDWDKPLVPVTENVTYKAIYSANETRVATVVSLINLLPTNNTFTFAYEGDLVQVDWGDGKKDSAATHTYEFPDNKPFSTIITIYGKLTSFALSNENGKLDKANLAVKNVVLAETITNVPKYAFNGLTYVNCVMIDNNATYVGQNAMKGISTNASIYLQDGFNESALERGWNPKNCHVVKDVSKLLLHYDESANVFYGFIGIKIENVQYLALADFYPYNGEQKTFETLTLPSSVDGEKVNAIIYSPFASSKYKFNKMIIPDSVIYIGVRAFRYAQISEIEIPTSVIEIAEDAFANTILTKVTFTGDNPQLAYIDSSAFSYNLKLTEVDNFPSSVTFLGDGVFFDCPLLTEVDGFGTCQIDKIPYDTFGSCHKLSKIVFPKNVKSVESDAFNTPALKSIDVSQLPVEQVPTCVSRSFLSASQMTTTVKVNPNFASAEEAKAAFIAAGWPTNFTYQVA